MTRRCRPSEPAAPAFFEPLEERLALYTSPFLAALPALSDLQNAANTVVRMQTNEGIIDIELYDRGGPNGGSAAPITTANFLRYISTGRYDNTFFHRLVDNPKFVLQGGGFMFTDGDAPPREVEQPTFPAIQNEFNVDRSNIAQTLAMAKRGGDPNSATDQFFFNLVDNAANLDGQNGGFTVFAHVIKGWDVVETISDLQTRDLNEFLTGNPQDAFNQVPVTGAADTDLVTITDIEVIKPAGSQQFFSQSVYYPEGFRSGRIVSSVELVNNDPNAANPYEIVAHFEGGLRDQVIFTNTLAPGQHVEIPISIGGNPSVNKVRAGEGFSYEIRSARPIGATLHHKDFGAVASEAFVQPDPFSAAQLQAWDFANGLKGPNNPSYIVWENLSDQPTHVNLLFFPDGGTPFYIGKTVQPYRRGGLDINQLPGVADGRFSIQMTSDHPIVAALSQYSINPGHASTETGVVAGGATQGVIPGAYIATGGQSIVSAMFTGSSPSIVTIDFDFILSDGSVIHSATPLVLTPAVPRRDLDLLSAAALPRDTFFTIRYRVRDGAAPVSMAYTGTVLGDTVQTPFETFAGAQAILAGGTTDPIVPQREVVSLYNPFASGTTATYRLRFHFSDGNDILVPAGTLEAGRRVDIDVRSLADVLAKISSGAQFHTYSISVDSSFAGTSTTGALFAQLTRFDVTGDSITTGPTLPQGVGILSIADPLFH
jgi:peptidyl-prolyl cis-trans isomerase A (cyclophilin A)